jgi:hypothetical protein
MDKQHGHGMGMHGHNHGHGHAALTWTYNMDMDMKHGHGHGPRTWRWSSTMDAGMPIKGSDRHHYFSVSLQYFSFQSLKSCPHGEIHMNMNINTDSDMVSGDVAEMT